MGRAVIATALVVAALALGALPAKADSITIGGSGLPCPSCNGVTITLTITGTGPSYTVTMLMDVSGITDPEVTGVASVEFKILDVATNADLTDFKINGTSQSQSVIDAWFVTWGPTNANACGGNMTTGKVCTEDSAFVAAGSALAPVNGSNTTFEWTWTVQGDFLGFDEGWHIGALFGHTTTNGCGSEPAPCFKQDFIISEDATTVPEPGTMALFGAGLLGLAAIRRRLL